jgi:hypothetical protein
VTPAIDKDERRQLRNAQRRVNRARENPLTWRCPASRYVHLLADGLATGKTPAAFNDEPGDVALVLYSVLESLWKARAK